LRPDIAAIEGVGGAQADIAEQKNFHVRFANGGDFSGTTRGFVKEASGLYLFPVEASAGATTSCFIPAKALKDVSIGQLIGEALAAKHLVAPRALATALDKQAAFRTEPIGEFLRKRAIVSPVELAKALKEQQRRPNVRIGQVLMEANLVSQDQLDVALTAQKNNRGRPIGEILVDMGVVSRQQIQEVLALKLGIPFINVREFKVDIEALKMAQASYAKQHQMLPLFRTKNALVVAVENPLTINFTQDLRFSTGLAIVPVMAGAAELQARIAKEYAALQDRSGPFNWDEATALAEKSQTPASQSRDELEMLEMHDLASQLSRDAPRAADQTQFDATAARVSESTMVRLVNKMVMDAHAQGASDIHIEANQGNRSVVIRFRKDGVLSDYLELDPAYRSSLVSRIKIMAELDISEHRHAQDGKIDFGRHGGIPIELRVAVIPTANNLEDVVLRVLAGAEPLPIDKLGLSGRNLEELARMVARSYGLILVCGPTGSGKTTTLHSVLRHLNQRETKIWTAEDPIEITQPGLRQVQVNAKIGWTFAAAMRAFLRADPDIIMVGEMRDEETTKIGIEASLTGHLVLSTLHTNSAAESIVRLLDLGMDPFNFADALLGILSQRLARRLCVKCRQPYAVSDKELAELAREYCAGTRLELAATVRAWHAAFGPQGQLTLYAANTKGCPACNAGYKGRVGLHELLVATPRIRQLIHERATAAQIAESAILDGMTLLRQDGIEKMLQGEIDLASARSAFS
jgi:type II secretory ATPase GspE/PulE/Tfp pilus assembly ATPase PilB-like protein